MTDVAPPKLDAAPAVARKPRVAVSDYSWADEGASIVVTLPLPSSVDDASLAVSHDEASLRVEVDAPDALRVLALPTPHGPFFRGITGVTTKRTAAGLLRLRVAQLIEAPLEVIRQ